MKLRIHWEIGDYEDSMDLAGTDIEDVRQQWKKEAERRGLGKDNNIWSESID